MQTFLIVLAVMAALLLLAWLGLHVKAAAVPAYPQRQPALENVPLPKGLPAPVERYYRSLFGEQVPLVRSAVISGRGTVRLKGLTLPIRFRFIHQAGRDYRHYIEVDFFGLPLMKINEYYVGGKERMEFPWGVEENNPKLDQGGVLGMWAESIGWLPSILVTDPQVEWQPLDEESAFLLVPAAPGQAGRERFLVRFDPACTRIRYWEVMRYQNGAGDKKLWINGAWFDDGRPWAVFNAEETVYNVDVSVSNKGLL
jgi:hypothetical protein